VETPEKPGAHDPRDDFEPAYLETFQRLIGEVFRFASQILAAGDQLGQNIDITVARWQALGVILYEPATVAEMSRRIGLTRQSVRETVNQLRKQGLVQSRSNPAHRRAPLIEMTPKGREVMEILLQRQAMITGWFTNNLDISCEDIQALVTRLQTMREQAHIRVQEQVRDDQ
jgi:DNA-binding MarR family transcriptional regulator